MDDLTSVIAEALGCEREPPGKGHRCEDYCRKHFTPWLICERRSSRVAAALAPLIEARLREAQAWGAAGALTALAHEVEDLDAADLATYRAMQWEAEAGEVRRG